MSPMSMPDKAQALKLKEVRGAVITLIDHDAPAGQIGLKVNDVVLAAQRPERRGAEQFRRMLREIPARPQGQPRNQPRRQHPDAGRRSWPIARPWSTKSGTRSASSGSIVAPPRRHGHAGRRWRRAMPGGFHMSFFGSSLNVGAMVEPLTSQMAEYLGVPGGLMVKQVARKSEAAAAGFKAFDVILKVGSDSITTLADWDRALRSNQGKPVQVTILRDKKQQTLTLQVDSKHRGAVEYEDLFGPDNDAIMAEHLHFSILISSAQLFSPSRRAREHEGFQDRPAANGAAPPANGTVAGKLQPGADEAAPAANGTVPAANGGVAGA